MRHLAIIALILLISCLPELNNPTLAPKPVTAVANTATDGLYFKLNAFKDTIEVLKVDPPFDTIKWLGNVPGDKIRFVKEVRIDSTRASYYSHILRNAQEPILSHSSAQEFLYRFTWLRSFDETLIIKLFQEPGATVVETKWMKRNESIKKVLVRRFDKNKFKEFSRLLEQVHFRQMPSVVSEGLAFDGSHWLLEAKTKDSYHFVNRFSPSSIRYPGIRRIGEWLIHHSDATQERIY